MLRLECYQLLARWRTSSLGLLERRLLLLLLLGLHWLLLLHQRTHDWCTPTEGISKGLMLELLLSFLRGRVIVDNLYRGDLGGWLAYLLFCLEGDGLGQVSLEVRRVTSVQSFI